MIFTHNPIIVPKLKKLDLPTLRLYEHLETKKKFVSITTVISHNTKHKFQKWREEKGEKEANRITTRSTTRGTKTHTLIEHYTNNLPLPDVDELFKDTSDEKLVSILNPGETLIKYKELPYFLFENLKPRLNRIHNIIGNEISLYSNFLSLAGTSDCIGQYDNTLSIIDYKGSEYIKRKEWIVDYFVQELAYRYMLYELTGKQAKQLVILMTAENGETETFVETNFSYYMRILLDYVDRYTKEVANDYGFKI